MSVLTEGLFLLPMGLQFQKKTSKSMVLSVVNNSRNRKSEKGLPFELIFSTGQSIIINSAYCNTILEDSN